jgi:hypothetical protein
MPWMVYGIFSLIAVTSLYFLSAARLFARDNSVGVAGNIIGLIIYLCK